MGKSTLLNVLVPDADAATREYSSALDMGRHTTTSTRLYHLPAPGGDLIDSPGFQAFGLQHLSGDDILRGFPEFTPHIERCRFYNCTHRHEPGCGVVAALRAGEIDAARYALYERILDENEPAQRYCRALRPRRPAASRYWLVRTAACDTGYAVCPPSLPK